jgi:hypothetical protein
MNRSIVRSPIVVATVFVPMWMLVAAAAQATAPAGKTVDQIRGANAFQGPLASTTEETLGLTAGVAHAEVAPDAHRIYVLGLGAQNASYDCKQGERIEGATVEIVVNTLPGTDVVSGSADQSVEDWSCRVNWQVEPG